MCFQIECTQYVLLVVKIKHMTTRHQRFVQKFRVLSQTCLCLYEEHLTRDSCCHTQWQPWPAGNVHRFFSVVTSCRPLLIYVCSF